MSTYFGLCGDNWVAEGVEIGLPPPGNIGRRDLLFSCKIILFRRATRRISD
jgi:hypothetical protein